MHALVLMMLAAGGDLELLKVEGAVKFTSDQVLVVADGQALLASNGCLTLKKGTVGWALVVPSEKAPAASNDCAGKKLDPEGEYPVGTIGKAKFLGHTPFAYAGELSLNPKAEVKPHQHDTSDEVVILLSGSGTFTVGDQKREVKAGDVMHIPKATQHRFVTGAEPVKAIQFYSPPGPEERFKKK
jgi:mannose-6-phosphate isomerase-like protein (cupin superfamily)